MISPGITETPSGVKVPDDTPDGLLQIFEPVEWVYAIALEAAGNDA